MPMQGSFDAQQFKPNQSGQPHPVGSKFDFQISNTEIVQTKDQQSGMFVVEFTTPAGSIVSRYNIWNANPRAAEIAHGQLSALCHATGVFRLDWQNDGAALRGARGKLDVGYQKGEEPTADRPHGGYVEVKRVYDANGNEPGRGNPAPPASTMPAGWQPASREPVQTVQGHSSGPAWNGQPQPQPAPAASPAPQGWTLGANTAAPPWANK